jgi:hypothetical protein
VTSELTTFLQIISTNLLFSMPNYIVMIVGIIIASMRWKRHPQLSRLVLIALIAMITLNILSVATSNFLIYYVHDIYNMSFAQITIFTAISSIFFTLLHAGAMGLLLWAIFGWRQPAASYPYPMYAQPDAYPAMPYQQPPTQHQSTQAE